MLDEFLIDDKKKVEFAKFELGETGNWYEVRSMDFKPYLVEFDRIQNKFAKFKKRGQPINEQKERNEMASSFVRHLLHDWKFTATKKVFEKIFPDIEVISTDDKKVIEVPFCKKSAYDILKNKKMAKVLGYMIANSADADNFTEPNFDDDLKN